MSLRILCEALELDHLRTEVTATYDEHKDNITKTAYGPESDRYLVALGPARRFLRAIQAVFATDSEKTVTKDIVALLRGMTYAITSKAFGDSPTSEAAVHDRIEAVLRCVFPDLIRKPSLTKPIKRFEPDTGIPSIQTLLEYKFISEAGQVSAIADEILADTRGYHSVEWKSFIYVIYETERFKPEYEWRQLLQATGVPDNTSVVVLSGNAIPKPPGRRTGPRPTSG
jgi:hypothetical protein